ncbi:MAG: hypothetical protein MUC92_10635 [Fimbriimonadaceae bacterium]|jgi:hypothetical protein|nr:hypothetical protein [Fimbriimonadaceae bacterium]
MSNPWANAGKNFFLWVAIPGSLLALGYYVLGPRISETATGQEAKELTKSLVGEKSEPETPAPASAEGQAATPQPSGQNLASNVRSYPAASLDEPSVEITIEPSTNRSRDRIRSSRIANEDGSSEPVRRPRRETPRRETPPETPDAESEAGGTNGTSPRVTPRRPQEPRPAEQPSTPRPDPASGGGGTGGGGTEAPPSTPPETPPGETD